MTPAAPPAQDGWSLSEHAGLALTCVHQHRLLSTGQLHELIAPDRTLRDTQRQLERLRDRGLLARVRERAGSRGTAGVWHLTPRGADVVAGVPGQPEPRRRVLTPDQAAGPLQQHTLAVNETAIAFVKAARERGEDCGPLAWRHEIAHPVSSRKGDVVIVDALLRYLTHGPDGELDIHYRFVELDRATVTPDVLASKLGRYALLARHRASGAQQPLWREQYLALPVVLLVLTGASTRRLERRRRAVAAMAASDPRITATGELNVTLCLLDELSDQGPHAPIFTTLADQKTRRDWLLQPA